MGVSSGDIGGDKDDAVEVGDGGAIDAVWCVLRVIYGVLEDEDDEPWSSHDGEYEHLSSKVTFLRRLVVRRIGCVTQAAKSCSVQAAERTGIKEP